jgi:hypothetical protein
VNSLLNCTAQTNYSQLPYNLYVRMTCSVIYSCHSYVYSIYSKIVI